MSTFSLWVERLFLAVDEWLYLFTALSLLFKWVQVKVALIRSPDTGGIYEHAALLFQARVHLIVFLVWVIVGAIFVYGVGYPMFFYRLRDEAPCLCSYIARI